ncbi:hypothetical protein NNL28_00365 [Ligilactobacillus salivarius]|nr:hypothetical protein [Ligilactobacillus salivarius]UTX36751.1 hypothetical protein NNL28_00365 [Ligilactobacillus salivarius]
MEISQSKDVIDRVHLQYLSHMYNLRKSDLTGVNEEKFEQYTVNYMNRRKRYLE